MTNKQKSVIAANGWTVRANINSDCIISLKRWNKNSAKEIAKLIKLGDCKGVISELKNAKNRNRQIRELSEFHDKIIYDKQGVSICYWGYKEQKTYKLEN